MRWKPQTELGKKLLAIRNRAIRKRAKKKETLTLVIELEYDPELMHGNDPDAIEWFLSTLLNGDLTLHSNDVGDDIWTTRVIGIIKANNL